MVHHQEREREKEREGEMLKQALRLGALLEREGKLKLEVLQERDLLLNHDRKISEEAKKESCM